MSVGDRWISEGVEYRVIWVGTKKVRLHASLPDGKGWITVTAWIDRLLDSPDWEQA